MHEDWKNSAVRRLLLVEDDAATRSMIERHLRRSGYAVTAHESAEAVSLEVAYAVVVTDVHLPGMNGLELATRLLAQRPDQPIVLITGDPDEALAREALARGPVGYLLKPFELYELDSAVQQLTQRVQARAEQRARLQPASAGAVIPEHWLQYLDASSYAGAGHSQRVVRLVQRLSSGLPDGVLEVTDAELVVAATSHELGRLVEPSADPITTAASGARLLRELGCSQAVVCAVRHMHERWNGTGGPSGLSGWEIPTASLILSVADALDHYVGAWCQTGASLTEAVDRAIGLVLAHQGTVFSPLLANAVKLERAYVKQVCAESSGAAASVFDPAGRTGANPWPAVVAG